MTLEDLTHHIHQWGVDRKIIGNGNLQTQWYKLMSEYGELCDSLAKGKSPIDDIGDIYVVLVMMAGIAGTELSLSRERPPFIPPTGDCVPDATLILNYCLTRMHPSDGEFGYPWIVGVISNYAKRHNITIEQCVEHAWNEIKDRKGYLNEQGVFVKEESA
jgi:hypothetical protein